MREFTAALIFAAALIATDATAEAWSVQDKDGNWSNTEHHPDNQKPDRPNGDKPGRVEGEKPQREARTPERPSDAKRTTRGHYCIAPTGQIAAVDGATGPIPATLPKCGPWVHIKGGVVGQW